MIARCREAGLVEPEFKLTDGFVAIIRRKAGIALEKVTGRVNPEATPEVTAQATAQLPPEVLDERIEIHVLDRRAAVRCGYPLLLSGAARPAFLTHDPGNLFVINRQAFTMELLGNPAVSITGKLQTDIADTDLLLIH